MDSEIDFATIIVAVCIAAYAAIMLACVADDFDLPGAQIRRLAMTAAVCLALPVRWISCAPGPTRSADAARTAASSACRIRTSQTRRTTIWLGERRESALLHT
ncbi:hypothetical protein MTX26_17615 [Bradyrhizobium sp. ISRA443]|uniref:hypothetical protein n=1 Tax=unclassified Bradyrhizobium TaxID=2631580 RepID=UPI00247A6031|nr:MULTISPECIES: hypothetical protein [unclassified Bradyrhizobium]WGR92080.1 hypothetical protein MTX20_28225 [Bradyrhizobium sp. ISRA435]WGS02533.1 hypothetical protein MTX23_17625 [Bradyrhizobium sp. ISRA436]WGS09418.1 hypothetical protein MTX18_17615 [Bradyrhizobium sp. ISRA437]WGS16307.1 hypothetical protein MTX26_17615 [Bradyrhizobium sp. ISRA443]